MQLKSVIDKYGRSSENLIHILLEYQSGKESNFISEDEVKQVAEELGVTQSRVYSVITFYSLFSTTPRGKYVIQVCSDVPCYVNGSVDVLKEIENILGISPGETTKDRIFTVERTSCIGCCDMSPAMRIGEELYGNLTSEKIAKTISQYRRKYNENKE